GRADGDDVFHGWEGLLGGVQLAAVAALEALGAAADRELPDAAHLLAAVLGLQVLVVEGVALALLLAAAGPDQFLVGVAEADAAEVRRGVDLLPDDGVEHPEAEILEG